MSTSGSIPQKCLSMFRFVTVAVMISIPDILYAMDVQGAQTTVVKGPVSLVSILQILTYLMLVILVIVGGAWLVRRYGRINSAANGNLKIIAGLSVGQREKIVLVEAGDVQLLLGVAPGRVQTLHVIEGMPVTEVKDIKKDTFISRFNDEIRKKIVS